MGDAWSPDVATIRIGEIKPGATIATTSAIVAPDGSVRTPATGPQNPVPLLEGAP